MFFSCHAQLLAFLWNKTACDPADKITHGLQTNWQIRHCRNCQHQIVSACLSLSIRIHENVFVWLSLYLPVCLSFCLGSSVRVSVCLSVCSQCLSVWPSVFLCFFSRWDNVFCGEPWLGTVWSTQLVCSEKLRRQKSVMFDQSFAPDFFPFWHRVKRSELRLLRRSQNKSDYAVVPA